jgi:hypothetical protein
VPSGWGNLLAVAGGTPRDAWYLFEKELARFDGAAFTPVFQQLETPFSGLALDPQAGLLLYGSPGLYTWDGAVTRDVTPRLGTPGNLVRANFQEVTVTAGGDLVAVLSPARVLRRVAGEWDVVEGENYNAFGGQPIWGLAGEDPGEIYMTGPRSVFRYRAPAIESGKAATP